MTTLGAVGSRTVDARPAVTSGGARLSGILMCKRDAGFAAGGDIETSWRLDEEGEYGSDYTRTRLVAGYANVPLPYRSSRVGIEAYGAFGFGSHPYRGHAARALSAGPRIAIPIRLTKRRPLWDEEKKAGVTHMIVPTFDWAFYLPVGSNVSHTVHHEATVGIGYRGYLWSALIP